MMKMVTEFTWKTSHQPAVQWNIQFWCLSYAFCMLP